MSEMSRFERWFLHFSAATLGASGVAFAVMKYLLEPVDPYALINHPLQPWMLAAHVLAAPLILFAVGIIVKDHIWAEVRRRTARNRLTGLASFIALGIGVLSGYLLQTTTREGLRTLLMVAHLGFGVIFLLGYLAHFLFSRNGGRKPRRRGGVLVSVPPPRYNSTEQNSKGDPTPSVEGLA
jgi:hypothetical protein